jgi:hypothetical protein
MSALKFMTKKGFHPGTWANRKRLEDAEEQSKKDAQHAKERQAQLDKERYRAMERYAMATIFNFSFRILC